MALLQPAPEVYNLFDDIMLLAEGHIVYYGPKEEVCFCAVITAAPALLQRLTGNVRGTVTTWCHRRGRAHVLNSMLDKDRYLPLC